jgi:hypothetical protein
MTNPDDVRLVQAFGALGPSPSSVARIETGVLEKWAERVVVPFTLSALAGEWRELLSRRPAQNSLLLAAAALILLLGSPLALAPLAWLA